MPKIHLILETNYPWLSVVTFVSSWMPCNERTGISTLGETDFVLYLDHYLGTLTCSMTVFYQLHNWLRITTFICISIKSTSLPSVLRKNVTITFKVQSSVTVFSSQRQSRNLCSRRNSEQWIKSINLYDQHSMTTHAEWLSLGKYIPIERKALCTRKNSNKFKTKVFIVSNKYDRDSASMYLLHQCCCWF